MAAGELKPRWGQPLTGFISFGLNSPPIFCLVSDVFVAGSGIWSKTLYSFLFGIIASLSGSLIVMLSLPDAVHGEAVGIEGGL